jgi:hypothetical protein
MTLERPVFEILQREWKRAKRGVRSAKSATRVRHASGVDSLWRGKLVIPRKIS